MTEQSDSIRLGVLGKKFGLEGGYRCRLDFPSPPNVQTPCAAMVGYSFSFAREIELQRVETGRAGEIICFFSGFENREAEQSLLDMALFVEKDCVTYGSTMDDPGVVGFQVVDQFGVVRGRVVGLIATAGHPVWRVEQNGNERLIPAVEEFVVSLDQESRIATIRVIPGLLDDDAEEVRPDEGAD